MLTLLGTEILSIKLKNKKIIIEIKPLIFHRN